MKRSQQNSKRWASMIGMVCLLTALLTSCSKNFDNDQANVPAGLISVINTSPDAVAQDFYLDNNRVNTTPIPFGNGLDYFRAATGKRTAYFYNSSTQTKIASDTLTVIANKPYSLFLINRASSGQILRLNDNFTQPAAGMAGIRFVDVSPDAPNVDFAIQGGQVIAANMTFKAYTDFVPVAANTSLTFELRRAGTTTVLLSLPKASLQAGVLYTVWLQGFSAATDQTKLALGTQTNIAY